MEKFMKLTGVAAPMDVINVDTDQIIPKLHLRTIKRTGLGKVLFDDLRFNPDGTEKPGFILNQAPYRDAQILVAGDNFGCGSSREHARGPCSISGSAASSPAASPTSSTTTASRTASCRSRSPRTSFRR